MSTTEQSELLEVFGFWGHTLTKTTTADEVRGLCPACYHKSNKMYVNTATTMFQCKHCGEKGNAYTFLQKVYDSFKAVSPAESLVRLAELRPGVSVSTLEMMGVIGTIDQNVWIMPTFNIRGSLNGLTRIRYTPPTKKDKGFFVSLRTKGLPHTLLNLQHFQPNGPVYICEGEWDTFALQELLLKTNTQGCVVGVPGASVWKNGWVEIVANREVYLCPDNDKEGRNARERIAELLRGHAARVYALHWPPGTPDKHDVRDVIVQQSTMISEGEDQTPILNHLYSLMVDMLGMATTKRAPDVVITETHPDLTFVEILSKFRSKYHMDATLEMSLAIMAAVVFSNQLHDDPLWVMQAGPPGSGKTLWLRAFERSPYCIFKSSITPASLISGFRMDDGSDPSLLPQLTGKTLILKDFTEILAGNESEVDDLYGILRGAYDGSAEKTFGWGGTRAYPNCYFSMLAGVTNVIHGNNRATLGERFLKFQMVTNKLGEGSFDSKSHVRAALRSSNVVTEEDAPDPLKDMIAAFTDRRIPRTFKDLPLPVEDRLIALAELIAAMRADLQMVRGEMVYESEPEVASRIGKQLLKLGRTVSIVFGGDGELTPFVWDYVERCAFDTVRSLRRPVLLQIIANALDKDRKNKPTMKEEIMALRSLPETSARRILDTLSALNLVEPGTKTGAGRGRPGLTYQPTEALLSLWKEAKVQWKSLEPIPANFTFKYPKITKAPTPKTTKRPTKKAARKK